MRSILFEIGPFKVYGYGLMIAIGVILAVYVAERRAKKLGLEEERILNLAVWCAVGGFLGAKLLYIITDWKNIISGTLQLQDILYGFVVYGGIIGGIFSGWLYTRVHKVDFLKYFDLVMPSIALAQGFGRLGCFLAGCCYGKRTDAWYGMEFNHSVYDNMTGVRVIPTQLISSAADFLHFAVLVLIANKAKKDGVVAGCYLIFYSVGRFLIEFLRDDPRGALLGLSTSQFISLFILAAGVAVTVVCSLRKGEKDGSK